MWRKSITVERNGAEIQFRTRFFNAPRRAVTDPDRSDARPTPEPNGAVVGANRATKKFLGKAVDGSRGDPTPLHPDFLLRA